MSAPVTARELEAAQECIKTWSDSNGEMEPPTLYVVLAQALVDARAAGYERGRREQREADATRIDEALGEYCAGQNDEKHARGDCLVCNICGHLTRLLRASAGPDGREP